MAHASFKINGTQFASFDLKQPILIGRSADCHVVVRDTKLSRKHLRLEKGEEGWVAIDLNSTNGTTVEGLPVQRQRLEDGDLIEASPLAIIFHDVRPPTLEANDFASQIVIDPADLAVDLTGDLADDLTGELAGNFDSAPEPAAQVEPDPEAIIAQAKKSVATMIEEREQQWAQLARKQEAKPVKKSASLNNLLSRLPRPVALSMVGVIGLALFYVAFTLTNLVAN